MIKFPSDLSPEELAEKWDDQTSPARFAGNDDTMDLIFVSKRKNENVRLVRKARTAHEPFSCVFRGKIRATEKGSEIVGIFTKAWGDYAVAAAILAFLFYIRSIVIERGGSYTTVNALLAVAIIGSILLLLNYRISKRKYAEFIYRITGKELPLFLTRKEIKEHEEKNSDCSKTT